MIQEAISLTNFSSLLLLLLPHVLPGPGVSLLQGKTPPLFPEQKRGSPGLLSALEEGGGGGIPPF